MFGVFIGNETAPTSNNSNQQQTETESETPILISNEKNPQNKTQKLTRVSQYRLIRF